MVGVISENRFDYNRRQNAMKTHTASSGPVCDGKGHAKMRPSEVNGGLKHPYPAGNGDVSLGKERG